MGMKKYLDNYLDDGAQQALVTVGMLTLLGAVVRHHQGKSYYAGGSGVRDFFTTDKLEGLVRDGRVDEARRLAKSEGRDNWRPSTKLGSMASEWNNFVAKRVPELVSSGKTAPVAMQLGADEFHR